MDFLDPKVSTWATKSKKISFYLSRFAIRRKKYPPYRWLETSMLDNP
jgi:hypothetical protein